MKRKLLALALACLPGLGWAETPALARLDLDAPHHGRTMTTTLWYPGSGGTEARYGDNPVFHGVAARTGADPAAGPFPVVLLSHGLGGHAGALSWLAAGLARRGAVVIAVDHPGSTYHDFDMLAGLDHWTRVQDLTHALDTLAADPVFGPAIDTGRVYAAGFSYGGWTALSLGGLRGSAENYAEYCDVAGEASTHCADLAGAGVDLRGLDAARWGASYRDARVRAVAAIDPGLLYGVTQDMADDLAADTLLIGLGDPADRLSATDFTATGSGFAARVPEAEILMLAPASHFTALPVCKPMGAAILAEEGDDPVCTDPEGTDRAAVHARIVAAMAEHFGL